MGSRSRRLYLPLLLLSVTACDLIGDHRSPPIVSGLDSRPSNKQCLAGERPLPADRVLELADAYPNLQFTYPVALAQAPNDDAYWFVVEKRGRVMAFPNHGDVQSAQLISVIDLSGTRVDALGGDFSSEAGLLGIAFHPDYRDNGYVYLSFTASNASLGLHSVISRFTMNPQTLTLDPASESVVLTVRQPYGNHNGGNIAFDRDGYLLIGLGDGGDGGDPHNNGQNTGTLLGAMLRIDVNVSAQERLAGKTYRIPPDNPFAASASCAAGACPEIFAWGLRNPWRWSLDRQTGKLWAGDVGQGRYEEIDIVEAGKNYGWSCYEGNNRYSDGNAKSDAQCGNTYQPPVLDYDRSQGYSVTGGYVYHGAEIPALTGAYVFADFGSGRLWALFDPYGKAQNREQASTGLYISAFGESKQGELYLLSYSDGRIKKIVAAAATAPLATGFSSLLSTSGCADAADPRMVSAGQIPYDVNSPLWSDGAEKKRWLAIPDGSRITVAGDGRWLFPTGSVLRKDFYLGGRIIETRLLARHTDGEWAGYSYEWDDAQHDANLLSAGKSKVIDGQTWTYPAAGDCLRCHGSAAARALGPQTAQLNGDYTYERTGRRANQLVTLQDIGLFAAHTSFGGAPTLADPANAGADLTDRARAYLHANCANCHRPEGSAPGSMDLRYDTPLARSGACDVAPTEGDLGIANARLIAPGQPQTSLLSVRMHSVGDDRMPPLGRHLVDEAGVGLIDAWITALTGC